MAVYDAKAVRSVILSKIKAKTANSINGVEDEVCELSFWQLYYFGNYIILAFNIFVLFLSLLTN